MAPSLHPRNYPHIVESVLQHLEYDDLLTARLVSPCMVPMADKLMAGDELAIMKLGGRLTFTSERGCLPFFRRSPPLSTPAQVHAMRRARHVVVYSEVAPSKRINALLAHLSPDADVTLEHGRNAASAFRLPRIRRLKLIMDPSCDCKDVAKRGPAGAFVHGAARVDVTFRMFFAGRRTHTPVTGARCHIVSSLLSPDVRELRVRTPSLVTVKHAFDLLIGHEAQGGLQSHIIIVKPEGPELQPPRYPITREKFAQYWYSRVKGVAYLTRSTSPP